MSAHLACDYAVGDELGRGRFGVVRRAVSRASGAVFAVKSVEKSLLLDDVDREGCALEPKLAALAAAAAGDLVVGVHAAYEDEEFIHTVVDLCDGPDLFDWLKLRGGAPVCEPEACAIVARLVAALAACHSVGVVHRDVKPDNIFLGDDGAVRLGDFGSAALRVGGAMVSGLVGTPYYLAPEVVAGDDYDESVDLWSAGVVMYVLLSGGCAPFGGETAAEIMENVLRGRLRFPTEQFAGVSPAAKDLMRKMMRRDPATRFSAQQVLLHSWIRSAGGSLQSEELAGV